MMTAKKMKAMGSSYNPAPFSLSKVFLEPGPKPVIRRNLGADPDNPIASMKVGQYCICYQCGNVFSRRKWQERYIAFTME